MPFRIHGLRLLQGGAKSRVASARIAALSWDASTTTDRVEGPQEEYDSERFQPGEDIGIGAPGGGRRIARAYFARLQSFSLHRQVNFDVAVGRDNAGVPEPAPDDIDLDSG